MKDVIIVNDSCIDCSNLLAKLETGRCECGAIDIAKGTSQAEISGSARHGKRVDIQKPNMKKYSANDIQKPLRKLMVAMDNLALESERLHSVTKGISESLLRKRRNSKRKNAKIVLQITVNDLEKSMVDLEQSKKAFLNKSDDFVVLGVLDGSMSNGLIKNWIEKKKAGL